MEKPVEAARGVSLLCHCVYECIRVTGLVVVFQWASTMERMHWHRLHISVMLPLLNASTVLNALLCLCVFELSVLQCQCSKPLP